MNWKEFLKPDWRKIVLTIELLTLIIFVIIYINNLFGWPRGCFTLEIKPWYVELMCLLWLLFDNFIIKFILIISSFVFSYLLSCLIVWIYDKVKKKK